MADMSNRVNIHSKLTVVSSRPIGPGKTHPLSVLDHAMGLHTFHIVFYYRTNPFIDTDLLDLRVSLTELLCSYPPVTGRLARAEDGNWAVKCNDAGVRMLKAKVGTTLDEWLRSADGSDERDLTVFEDMPDDPSIWSPFSIQINDFEGGGLAIGLSCTHMLADPTSATIFIKSWTELHRGQPISHPPLFHPTLPLLRHGGSSSTSTTSYLAAKSKYETPSVKMSTLTFKFSHSRIEQCMSRNNNKCPNCTPFDVLAALFWTRIAKLKSSSPNISLSLCMDSRKLIDAPYDFFGNALHFSQLVIDSEDLNSDRLGDVAAAVHRHMAELKGKDKIRSIFDWFGSRKGEEGKYPAPFQMYGPDLTCVSLEHMIVERGLNGENCESLMYEAMFTKDEKPVHVSYRFGNADGEGLIVVTPSPQGGLGRTVLVTLPEEIVRKLYEDPSILELEPTMVISRR